MAVSRLQLTVLPEVTRLAGRRVVDLTSRQVNPLNLHLVQVEVLEVQGPCNLQIRAFGMPRLRKVVARPVCPPEGPSCTFGRGKEAPHRLGRCLVDIKHIYLNAFYMSAPLDGYRGAITFNKVELPVVEWNQALVEEARPWMVQVEEARPWMVEVKEVLYKAYKEEGGVAKYKAWHKANWS